MKTWSRFQCLAFAAALLSVSRAGDLTPSQQQDAQAITCNNVIYAGGKTSVCFADKFLVTAKQKTGLNIQPGFKTVRLDGEAFFDSPFTVISGEGDFRFSPKERENLKRYLTTGGFLLASPGCSDEKWDASFRAEIASLLPDSKLVRIPMTHPVFSTSFNVGTLNLKSGGTTLVEGIEMDGRLIMIYSTEGLNDAANAKGCCCCGGNQIRESEQVNVNILLYSLLH